MTATKPKIVFASAVCPGQYSLLCQYLNESGLATAYFMTTPGNRRKNQSRFTNLIEFKPDGDISQSGYYYSAKAERSARLARGLYVAIRDFIRNHGKPDLIVGHSSWAPPQFVIRELDIPVVTYLEFPSYFAHGWDPAYPPDLSQRLTDCNMEMISYHHVLSSALTIVPSAFARSLLPRELQAMVEVQFEGFDIDAPLLTDHPLGKSGELFTLGFTARDLSLAKGLEVYVRLVDRLVREGDASKMKFIAVGDPAASTYGYDRQFAQRYFKDESKTFLDYLLIQYPAANVIEFTGKLPYAEFADLIYSIDLFLYPLQHGVANWGLMEIMARGKPVIASNCNFIPEIISNGKSGILISGDDDEWIREIRRLRDNSSLRKSIGKAAAKQARHYHISSIAERYMKLFRRAMARGNRAG
jgi:glycosyltransferase involved in cell wall biosynthesis